MTNNTSFQQDMSKQTLLFVVLLIIFSFVFMSCSKSDVDSDETEQTDPKEDDGDKNKPTPVEETAFAFPGAEGFGKNTTGGRGGRIIKVTNLNDSGTGSFRAAVTASGPRIVVFDVAGVIYLKSRIAIKNGDLTIAGQTAPGDGITIANHEVNVGADNVIIRFMRFRMGDLMGAEADALGGRFQKNIIVDHCSMSWSTDECVSFYQNTDFTLQWCYITESLRNATHEKGAHGYGAIWGGKNASFHHNLIAHHDSRNPRFGESAGDAFALSNLVDFRNNVIYNWGNNSAYGAEAANINMVANYYKPGPASRHTERIISIDKYLKDKEKPTYNKWGKFFIADNYIAGSARATQDNWTYGVYNQFHGTYGTVSEDDKKGMRKMEPHPIDDNVTTHSAEEAYELVLELGGASYVRDAIDTRIINEVREGKYTYDGSNGSSKGIIDSQNDVGGWPEYKSGEVSKNTSGDGIPDAWKIKHGLDVDKDVSSGYDLSTGYTNIEVYMNSLVKHLMNL